MWVENVSKVIVIVVVALNNIEGMDKVLWKDRVGMIGGIIMVSHMLDI